MAIASQMKGLLLVGDGYSGNRAPAGLVSMEPYIEPGTVAAVLVWENSWAGPFGAAVRRAGGQLVANGRINTQALLAAAETEEGA